MTMTLDEIGAKLDLLIVKVQALEVANAERDVARFDLRKDVDKLIDAVEGNGKEGLKIKVALLQDQVSRMIAMGTALVTITAAQIIGLAIAFLTHTITFNP